MFATARLCAGVSTSPACLLLCNVNGSVLVVQYSDRLGGGAGVSYSYFRSDDSAKAAKCWLVCVSGPWWFAEYVE